MKDYKWKIANDRNEPEKTVLLDKHEKQTAI